MPLSLVVMLFALLCLPCVLILAVQSGRAGTRRAWVRGGRGARRARRAWLRGDSGHRDVPQVRLDRTGVDRPAEPGDGADGAAHPLLHGDVADARALSRDRADRQMRRAWARGNRANRPALRRLDRRINQPPFTNRPVAERRLPPVEQIAAELRRLDRQRRQGLSNESEKWSAAVTTAYDAWLLAACRRLDITEHLTTLDGMDLEIERVRVEGQLETAGLVLRSTSDGR